MAPYLVSKTKLFQNLSDNRNGSFHPFNPLHPEQFGGDNLGIYLIGKPVINNIITYSLIIMALNPRLGLGLLQKCSPMASDPHHLPLILFH